MAKYSAKNKLAQAKQQELLVNLCQALVVIRNPEEAANILKDLLSPQELEMLAKRLQIAKMLLEDKTYAEIQSDLKVSRSKIARVSVWLATSGDGFRLVARRTPSLKAEHRKRSKESSSWGQFKKRHPVHFWPEEAVKEVLKTAAKTRKKRTLQVLAEANKKPRLYEELEQVQGDTPHPKSK